MREWECSYEKVIYRSGSQRCRATRRFRCKRGGQHGEGKAATDVTQQSTDFSSHRRNYRHYSHYGYRHYRPYYRSYGYAPRPYYGRYGGGYGGPYYGGGYGYGGPSVSFSFGGGGYRGW